MGYFEQMWAIQVLKWHFFLQYWYVSVIAIIIAIIFICFSSKN